MSLAMAEIPSDINSYCFEKNVNLQEVNKALNILLLPRDIVEFRNEDNCIDIDSSPERGKLFEKYLSKRYLLKTANNISSSEAEKQTNELGNQVRDCSLELKTTKKSKTDSTQLKVGEKNVLNKTETASTSISTTDILLGTGKTGEIIIGDKNLKVICHLIGIDKGSLVFSYSEKNKANINTEVQVKKGEWLNIATVLKDLSDKVKTLGMPQTEISKSNEKTEMIYELQLK